MNEALGEVEGRAGAASVREVVGGIQDLDFNSERMRRRIMSSGTREPDCMWDSASWPATRTLLDVLICNIEATPAGKHKVRRRGMGLTQGRFVANGIAQ